MHKAAFAFMSKGSDGLRRESRVHLADSNYGIAILTALPHTALMHSVLETSIFTRRAADARGADGLGFYAGTQPEGW